MSVKVAIACEDHTLDQYILVPVVSALMNVLGKPRAKVAPVSNPRIRGDTHLMAAACELLDRYGPVADVVIFVIDIDCEDGLAGRPDKLLRLRNRLDSCDSSYRSRAVAVGAVNEAEVWALWGVQGEIGDPWQTVRADCHPKDTYLRQVTRPGDANSPGRGRKRLAEQSVSRGWASLKAACPELATLEEQVRSVVQ